MSQQKVKHYFQFRFHMYDYDKQIKSVTSHAL